MIGTALNAAGIVGPALRDSYLRCRRLHAARERTSFVVMYVVPPRRRPYLHALAAFFIDADDLVDEQAAPDARRSLTALARETMAEIRAGASSHPLRRALVHTVRTWGIRPELFEEHFAALRADLELSGIADEEERWRFLYGVTGVATLIALPILEPTAGAEPPAIALAAAAQLTDMLRDVAEDLARGRLYLPETALHEHGVSRAELEEGRYDDRVARLIAGQVELARRFYTTGAALADLVHPDVRPAIRAGLDVGQLMLTEIEHSGEALFRGRVRSSARRRLGIGLRAVRESWRARGRHSPSRLEPR